MNSKDVDDYFMADKIPEPPQGYCQCGCGLLAPIATKTSAQYGWIKGKPTRFISGHNGVKIKDKPRLVEFQGEKCLKIDLGNKTWVFIGVEDADLSYQCKWSLHSNGYAGRWTKKDGRRKLIFLHSIIAERMGIANPDHENRNKLDCRRTNLRESTRFENAQNQNIRKDNATGVRGTSLHQLTGKIHAQINVNGERIYLGLHDSIELAVEARLLASQKYHGKFAGEIKRNLINDRGGENE